MSVVDDAARVESLSALSRFRADYDDCLPGRPDTLFDLTDAVLCAEGPVTSLVELSLQSSFRRGHGALYDALARGGRASSRSSATASSSGSITLRYHRP